MLAPEQNLDFLTRCINRFRDVNFADQRTGRIYLSMVSGSPVWVDPEMLEHVISSADSRAALLAVAPTVLEGTLTFVEEARFLGDGTGAEKLQTLGRWGPSG